MKLSIFPAVLVLALSLTHCGKQEHPPEAPPAPTAAVGDQKSEELVQWRDALARQAIEVEMRSALLEQQLAEMEKKLQQQENDALRDQLDVIRQQNDALRSQADSARRQSDAISQKLADAAPPASVITVGKAASADYSIFYDRLAPLGRWFDVTGYGFCFQPRVARVATWRPYVDGCWSWTSLGWSWQSNEPFGWATYHYGRWVHLVQYGWLWVPGSEWAPAWVAWRQSRDHVGWAPLPPERGACVSVQRDCDSRYGLGPASYTFIQTTNFIRPSYVTICHPVSYNSTIFRSTVNITQIVPCRDRGRSNMFMHHGGPPRHQIEQTCRQSMPEIDVRPVRPDDITLTRSHGSLARARHEPVGVVELPPASASSRLPQIRADDRIARPQLADTFAGVPTVARAEIQQRLVTEAVRVRVADTPQPQPVVPSPAGSAVAGASVSGPVQMPPPAATVPPADASLPNVVIPRDDRPPLTLVPSPPVALKVEAVPSLPDLPKPTVLGVNTQHLRSPLVSEGPRLDDLTRATAESPAISTSAPNAEPVGISPIDGVTTPGMPVLGSSQSPAQLNVAQAVELKPLQQVDVSVTPPPLSTDAADQTAAGEALAMQQRESEGAARAAAEQEAARQQTEALAMQQRESEGAVRAAAEQEAARQQAEALAMQQRESEGAARAAAEQEAARQQAEALAMQQRESESAARAAAEQEAARQQAEALAMQQRESESAARAAAEQEAARQQAEALAMQQRQAEEAAQRQAAEEQMRRAQEEAQRQQAEALAMQQRQAEEAARQAQEVARRAQEEAMQRAQEEAARQAQEEARRAQEEAMRRAQEEAARQAQEEARRAQEEAMRRAQEEAQRQAQEEARRQAEEAARRAQEEAQRQAQEAAARAAAEAANRPPP